MFSLKNYPEIVSFLKSKSNFFRSVGNEHTMFCCYCNDATRKINPTHGHLYLSNDYPVFHCFRCDISGSLPNLLIDLGYDNQEVLDEISSFIKFKFKQDFFQKKYIHKIKSKTIDFNDITYLSSFIKQNPIAYSEYCSFLISRIGETFNPLQFGLLPYIKNKELCVQFKNYNDETVCFRNISKKQYIKPENKNLIYFFQPWNFENYNSVVLTEGPFDIINTFLFSLEFKNSFYYSILGKNYISNVEKMVLTELLLGKYDINIIFDKDILNYKYILNYIKKISKSNTDICVKGYLPLIGKDVGEFPAFFEVN